MPEYQYNDDERDTSDIWIYSRKNLNFKNLPANEGEFIPICNLFKELHEEEKEKLYAKDQYLEKIIESQQIDDYYDDEIISNIQESESQDNDNNLELCDFTQKCKDVFDNLVYNKFFYH